MNFKFCLAETNKGVLRIHPKNSRYFTDSSGKPLYITGLHTWSVVFPSGASHAKDAYMHTANYHTFERFLDFIQSYNHNFTRLWTGSSYTTSAMWPWQRTGPGKAYDGKPKFDLKKFNQRYFDILRERVQQIENRGMYASIMIFGSHNKFKTDYKNIVWHPGNNVNDFGLENGNAFFTPNRSGIDAQRLLVKKFIETLNSFDNIIFEVMNEASFPESVQWQKEIVTYAKQYEAQLPKQHLWGITAGWVNSTPYLMDGPHDWWSPDKTLIKGYDYRQGGPASYSAKPVLVDSDHFDGGLYKTTDIHKGISLVWKTFTRGNYPILMDCYNDSWKGNDRLKGSEFGCNHAINHVFDPIRKALGHARRYANRLSDLSMTIPDENICSTTYCLVNPGIDYVIYQPVTLKTDHSSRLVQLLFWAGKKLQNILNPRKEDTFTLFLKEGNYSLEWFDPYDESISVNSMKIDNDGKIRFNKPDHIQNDAVLYLTKTEKLTGKR